MFYFKFASGLTNFFSGPPKQQILFTPLVQFPVNLQGVIQIPVNLSWLVPLGQSITYNLLNPSIIPIWKCRIVTQHIIAASDTTAKSLCFLGSFLTEALHLMQVETLLF